MNKPRHWVGLALLIMSALFGAWDQGVGTGKSLIAVVLFVAGAIALEVFSDERGGVS